MQRHISTNLMKNISDDLRVSTLAANFHFWLNYTFKWIWVILMKHEEKYNNTDASFTLGSSVILGLLVYYYSFCGWFELDFVFIFSVFILILDYFEYCFVLWTFLSVFVLFKIHYLGLICFYFSFSFYLVPVSTFSASPLTYFS